MLTAWLASAARSKEINELRTDASDIEGEALAKWERIEAIDAQLARHTALDDELKKLRANIRASEKKKDDMIAAARAKISEDEARQLILARFQRLLTEQFDGYLRQYQRAFIAAVENLWDKYAVTTKQILAERDQEAAQLDAFLKELGYECRPNGWTREAVRDLIVHHASGPSPTCDERNIASSEEWGLLKTTAVTWSGWDATAHKVPPRQFWGNSRLEVHYSQG